MDTDFTQRWRHGRGLYRWVGEPFSPMLHDVAEITVDRTAKRFVVEHHYSGSYPAARYRFGLFRRAELVGVAVFSVPMSVGVLRVFPCPDAGVELGRFVLLDEVAAHAESWFLARCFELLRHRGVEGVVSFSDPMARRRADGAVVFPGHVGTIYQASNALYLGRATARRLLLLPDGSVLSDRTLQKLRGGERGWRYAAELLERAGAAPLGRPDRALPWLERWLPRLTRAVRHPGNHRYVFALDRAVRRALADDGYLAARKLKREPYPRFRRAAMQMVLAFGERP